MHTSAIASKQSIPESTGSAVVANDMDNCAKDACINKSQDTSAKMRHECLRTDYDSESIEGSGLKN